MAFSGEWPLATTSNSVAYSPCVGSSLSALSATIPRSGTVVPPLAARPVDEPPCLSTLASNAGGSGTHPVYAPWENGLEETDVTYYTYYDGRADQP